MTYERFEAQTKALLIQQRVDKLPKRSFDRQGLLALLQRYRNIWLGGRA